MGLTTHDMTRHNMKYSCAVRTRHIGYEVSAVKEGQTVLLTFMASTWRGTALEAESEVPYPSWPWSLDPQLKTAPPSVRTAVCLLAAATATTRCLRLVTLYKQGALFQSQSQSASL